MICFRRGILVYGDTMSVNDDDHHDDDANDGRVFTRIRVSFAACCHAAMCAAVMLVKARVDRSLNTKPISGREHIPWKF